MTNGWIDDDTFTFFVPITAVDVSKGGKDKKDGKRWVQGIASTDTRDLQGEIVSQNGIDFTYFLKHGYFNDDHKPGPENKIGQPVECRVTKNGLWVKGFLFENHSRADHYWELLHALEASGSNRRVGFSIQGKVKRRKGSTIAECWIQDIALTPSPVNTTTWAEIAKSLSAQTWDLSREDTQKSVEVPGMTKQDVKGASVGAMGRIGRVVMSIDGEDSEEEDAEKSTPLLPTKSGKASDRVTLSTTAGNVTTPESLDSDEKVNRVTKSQAVEYLVKSGTSRDLAAKLVDIIFDLI